VRRKGKITGLKRARTRARNIRYSREAPSHSRRTTLDLITVAIAALFLAFVAVIVFAGRLPAITLVIYAGASIVAFLVYGFDKSAALNNRRRTSERTLHLISLAGGWPGALLAQRVLRHKSRKAGFQRVYWATVVVNCAAFLWLLTPYGYGLLISSQ
jgi:uncharacterized membrane protein YsdA (DUF1294 family)